MTGSVTQALQSQNQHAQIILIRPKHSAGLCSTGMTEFWVANAKHWCKHCKCWIDGKASSIKKHEGGKRHKEEHAKYMKGLYTSRREKESKESEFDKEMKRIEQAAMEASKADISAGVQGYRDPRRGPPPSASSSRGKKNCPLFFF